MGKGDGKRKGENEGKSRAKQQRRVGWSGFYCFYLCLWITSNKLAIQQFSHELNYANFWAMKMQHWFLCSAGPVGSLTPCHSRMFT